MAGGDALPDYGRAFTNRLVAVVFHVKRHRACDLTPPLCGKAREPRSEARLQTSTHTTGETGEELVADDTRAPFLGAGLLPASLCG